MHMKDKDIYGRVLCSIAKNICEEQKKTRQKNDREKEIRKKKLNCGVGIDVR